jgi:PPK2 family polyphosphate:nucleotide phosphotransferase
MLTPELLESSRKLAATFCITDGKGFRLKEHDPDDTAWFSKADKPGAQAALEESIQAIAALQEKLYAQDQWGLLLVFQAMDGAGKDSVIRNVMSGVNPAGCHVTSFKAPSIEELDHDYLWRCNRALPERGRIGVFNRSYYEEVLVVKVHPELLARQRVPQQGGTHTVWSGRYRDLRSHERYLGSNGFVVRKFFLHLSRAEQKKRFLARIDDPEKNWKFQAGDVRERGYWDEYMAAYESAIRETATPEAPWYVVPADNKWFTRLVVAAAIVDTLASLDPAYPTLPAGKLAELAECRKALLDEDHS